MPINCLLLTSADRILRFSFTCSEPEISYPLNYFDTKISLNSIARQNSLFEYRFFDSLFDFIRNSSSKVAWHIMSHFEIVNEIRDFVRKVVLATKSGQIYCFSSLDHSKFSEILGSLALHVSMCWHFILKSWYKTMDK